MFWSIWFVVSALSLFLFRETVKILRRNDVDIEGRSILLFFVCIVASLTPALNILALLVMIVFFLFIKWLNKKGESEGEVTFNAFVDDIFGLNKEKKNKKQDRH